MKLLLTSSGITNNSLNNALVAMLGKPIAECNALFVPTGMYPSAGGAYYAAGAIAGNPKSPLANLGWKQVGVLELSALTSIDKSAWVPTLQEADALLIWGGDPVFLAYWMQQSRLTDLFPSLHNLVYVGVSAGAMVACNTIGESYRNQPVRSNNILTSKTIIIDTPQGKIDYTFVTARGAGLADFAIIPHFENENHPDACGTNAEKWAAKIPAPVYAIDDNSGVKVIDGKAEVVSEGKWKLFNADLKPAP